MTKKVRAFFAHLKRLFTNPNEYRKAWVAITAIAAYVVNNNLLHGSALRWTTLAIGLVAALGVGKVSNDKPATDVSNVATTYVAPPVAGETVDQPGTTTPPDATPEGMSAG